MVRHIEIKPGKAQLSSEPYQPAKAGKPSKKQTLDHLSEEERKNYVIIGDRIHHRSQLPPSYLKLLESSDSADTVTKRDKEEFDNATTKG